VCVLTALDDQVSRLQGHGFRHPQTRVRTTGELYGILHDRVPPDGPLSWEDERRLMEEAVAREVAGR
jgi:hypothetical protein